MRTPTPYESFLLKLNDEFVINDGGRYRIPIWLVNSMRTYDWMFYLYRAMSPWNGYTVSKQLRFRIEHAPETRFRRCQEMLDDLREMLNEYCTVMQTVQEQIFSHFESNQTIVLMTKEDRQRWDDALEKLYCLLDTQPDQMRLKKSGVTESAAIASIPYDRLWK